MAYLLDTCVLSELRNPKRCHPKVAMWQRGIPQEQCFVSAVSYMEIRQGIEKVKSKDEPFSMLLDEWFEQRVKPLFKGRSFPVSYEIAELAGHLKARRSRGTSDALIAATALVLDLTLVTRNIADFVDTEVQILNPWD